MSKLLRNKHKVRAGDLVVWYEDTNTSYQSEPDQCAGEVLRVEDGRPVVQSHYDGRDLKLENWDLPRKSAMRRGPAPHRRFVGGKKKARR